MNNIPSAIKKILIVNIVMMIFTYLREPFMVEKFALFYPASPFFRPYQFVTYMFMHGNFFHLLFNMYTLVIFGAVLENIWGSDRFFLYYMATGLGAAAFHVLVMWLIGPSYNVPTVGASGAVYGVLLGYGMLFPNNILRLFFPPVSLKAKYLVLIFGALELLLGLFNSGDNVAHFAHLGGMLFGYLLIIYWRKKGKLY